MKIKLTPIADIKPYDNNVKKHDEAQVAGIAESIKKFGWDQPIVVDKDMVIIKGHGRRLAALKLGLGGVPVLIRDDLTPDQVRAARLADNRVALGDIDTALMRFELQAMDLTLLAGIFDPKELEFGTVDLGEMSDGAFIENVEAAVEKQDSETKAKVDALQVARVPVVRVLGFKDVQGSDEIYYSRFLALAETKTGMKGEQAMTAYVKELVGRISQD